MLDKHYLAPLFSPGSIAVLAGQPDDPDLTPEARALHAALRAHPMPDSRPVCKP